MQGFYQERKIETAFFVYQAPLTVELETDSILSEPYLVPPTGVERPKAWNHLSVLFYIQRYLFTFLDP